MMIPESLDDHALAFIYHLGFDPVERLFKLLKIPIYSFGDDDTVFTYNLKSYIFTVGVDSQWREIDPALVQITTASVWFGGELYWLNESASNLLISFYVKNEKFDITQSGALFCPICPISLLNWL